MDKAWLEVNQGLSHDLLSAQKELQRLKLIMQACPTCRRRVVWKSDITPPEWMSGPQWEGWKWNPRTQVAMRWSKSTLFSIEEDCGLVVDRLHFSDYHGAPSIYALDFETSRKVAELIAEADGGWGVPGDEDEDWATIPVEHIERGAQ